MINPFLEYEVVRERQRDLERELEHRRLIKELENNVDDRSRQNKLILSLSSIIVVATAVAQILG